MMAWLHNLLMLGKGPAPAGKLAFTTLSLSGTPGRSVTFTAKQAADLSVGSIYYLKFVSRIG